MGTALRNTVPSACRGKGGNVRFGSKADIAASRTNVRFTPKSGHQDCLELRSASSSATLAMFAAIRRASLRDAFNLLVRGFARLRVQYPRPTF